MKVFCNANFFIPDCTTYCTPRNDSSGHYTCDFTRGQKVCLPGWYGMDCLTYCIPRNDTLGHYSCDSNGQIKCLKNWYGKECLLYCKTRNDSLGHNSCDVNGQRRCLSGWFGKDCLTYSVPRNDSLGHYNCDVNGRRKCLSGWHGSYCLTYCVPSNDSLGHYTCGSNGQNSCLDYWYGTNCLIYCKPRNDSSGHYICNTTGYSVCLPGWQGEQCTEKEISKATFTASSTIVSGSTRSFQHQKTSFKVTSLLGNFSLRTDALIFRSTFAVGPSASKDGGVQSTEITKLTLFSSQLFELASQNKQTTSSFQHLSQFSAADSKRAVSTSTSGEILKKTEKQLISQPKETTRPLKSLVFHSLQPHMDMSSRQVSSLQPTPSSQQMSGLKFTLAPCTESNYIDDNLNWSIQQTERTRRTMTTSTLKSILHLSISQTANYRGITSSVQAWISMATPLIGKSHTTRKCKELSWQPVDMTRVKSHLALASVLKEHSSPAGVPTLVERPPSESLCTTGEMNMRESTRVQISPSTPSLQLASSTGSLCPEVDRATAKPDEAMPVSSRILVEFREKQEKKLVSC